MSLARLRSTMDAGDAPPVRWREMSLRALLLGIAFLVLGTGRMLQANGSFHTGECGIASEVYPSCDGINISNWTEHHSGFECCKASNCMNQGKPRIYTYSGQQWWMSPTGDRCYGALGTASSTGTCCIS